MPQPRSSKPGASKDGAYSSRLPDQDSGYRPSPPPPERNSGSVLLMGAVAAIAVLGFVVWTNYKGGTRDSEDGGAPALSGGGAFKHRPDDDGSSRPVEVDARVFDQVEGELKEETLAPADVREEPTPLPEPVAVQEQVAQEPLYQPPADPLPAGALDLTSKLPPVAPAPKASPLPPAQPAPRPSADSPAPSANATDRNLAATPRAPSTASRIPAPAPAAAGSWVVQLAAPSSEAAALDEWDRLKQKAPALFGKVNRIVERANVNGRTVYRLRAGPFASPEAAEDFCVSFKASGGDCYKTRS